MGQGEGPVGWQGQNFLWAQPSHREASERLRSGFYVYNLDLELLEGCYLSRLPTQTTLGCITWKKNTIGTANGSKAMFGARDELLVAFENDLLSVR